MSRTVWGAVASDMLHFSRSLFALALILLCSLALSACGEDDQPNTEAARPPAKSAAPETAPPVKTPTPSRTSTRDKPVVLIPDGPAPSKLVTRDLKAGKGAPARAGDTISVHYVGVEYTTGKQFDASWDRGEPFIFTLGQGMVIPGWDRGVVGMRPGGQRQLTIPPKLAYGAQGSPPAIGPNKTLVFVIDYLGSAPATQ